MKKRNVALLLCLVMSISALAGCGSKTEQPADKQQSVAPESKTDEKVEEVSDSDDGEIKIDQFAGTELNIVVLKDIRDTSTDETYGNKTVLKMAEEATGIQINWTVVDPATAADKISVLLASDDQPDAYIGSSFFTEDVIALNKEMFYDLSEEGLLETYAPDVLKTYEPVNMLEQLSWPDGSIYSLAVSATSKEQSAWPMSFTVIRKDWLEQLGMSVPTTADELYDVLIAFRDNDMNGNGDTTDEIPVTFCSGQWEGELMMHANNFGISGSIHSKATHYKMIQDGQVIPVCANDNFRAFLEFYHKLEEEDLLDMEGFSQTAEQYYAKIDEGIAGVYTSRP